MMTVPGVPGMSLKDGHPRMYAGDPPELICCAYRLWAWDCYRHPGLKAGIQPGARLWDKVVQRLYPALYPGEVILIASIVTRSHGGR